MARTTLIIPDALWREVKLRAAKENKNISEWVAEGIQLKLRPAGKVSPPKYKLGDVWKPKPMGLIPYPLTREHIYGPITEDPKTWR